MKILKIIIFSILIISFIKIYRKFNFINDPDNVKQTHLNESVRVLNKCFDLENKNNRTINESIKLIEYCLKEYGYKD